MTTVQLWFLSNAALCLVGAYASHEGADYCHAAGADLRSGVWTVMLYLFLAAALGNTGMLFVGDDPDDDGDAKK